MRYTYDVYGKRTTMTTYCHEPEGDAMVGRGDLSAPPGYTTTWLYDEASGVMTNKLYADGKGSRYTYTDDGKFATRTRARGIVTAYAYDAAGRRITCGRSGDAMTRADTIACAYNARGELTNAVSNVDANYAYASLHNSTLNPQRATTPTTGTRTLGKLLPLTE